MGVKKKKKKVNCASLTRFFEIDCKLPHYELLMDFLNMWIIRKDGHIFADMCNKKNCLDKHILASKKFKTSNEVE
jgi:hypothetical protein